MSIRFGYILLLEVIILSVRVFSYKVRKICIEIFLFIKKRELIIIWFLK